MNDLSQHMTFFATMLLVLPLFAGWKYLQYLRLKDLAGLMRAAFSKAEKKYRGDAFYVFPAARVTPKGTYPGVLVVFGDRLLFDELEGSALTLPMSGIPAYQFRAANSGAESADGLRVLEIELAQQIVEFLVLPGSERMVQDVLTYAGIKQKNTATAPPA